MITKPLLKKRPWDAINMNPGMVQILTPAPAWSRKLFNGLAQVIIETTGEPGQIALTATANGLKYNSLIITPAP